MLVKFNHTISRYLLLMYFLFIYFFVWLLEEFFIHLAPCVITRFTNTYVCFFYNYFCFIYFEFGAATQLVGNAIQNF